MQMIKKKRASRLPASIITLTDLLASSLSKEALTSWVLSSPYTYHHFVRALQERFRTEENLEALEEILLTQLSQNIFDRHHLISLQALSEDTSLPLNIMLLASCIIHATKEKLSNNKTLADRDTLYLPRVLEWKNSLPKKELTLLIALASVENLNAYISSSIQVLTSERPSHYRFTKVNESIEHIIETRLLNLKPDLLIKLTESIISRIDTSNNKLGAALNRNLPILLRSANKLYKYLKNKKIHQTIREKIKSAAENILTFAEKIEQQQMQNRQTYSHDLKETRNIIYQAQKVIDSKVTPPSLLELRDRFNETLLSFEGYDLNEKKNAISSMTNIIKMTDTNKQLSTHLSTQLISLIEKHCPSLKTDLLENQLPDGLNLWPKSPIGSLVRALLTTTRTTSDPQTLRSTLILLKDFAEELHHSDIKDDITNSFCLASFLNVIRSLNKHPNLPNAITSFLDLGLLETGSIPNKIEETLTFCLKNKNGEIQEEIHDAISAKLNKTKNLSVSKKLNSILLRMVSPSSLDQEQIKSNLTAQLKALQDIPPDDASLSDRKELISSLILSLEESTDQKEFIKYALSFENLEARQYILEIILQLPSKALPENTPKPEEILKDIKGERFSQQDLILLELLLPKVKVKHYLHLTEIIFKMISHSETHVNSKKNKERSYKLLIAMNHAFTQHHLEEKLPNPIFETPKEARTNKHYGRFDIIAELFNQKIEAAIETKNKAARPIQAAFRKRMARCDTNPSQEVHDRSFLDLAEYLADANHWNWSKEKNAHTILIEEQHRAAGNLFRLTFSELNEKINAHMNKQYILRSNFHSNYKPYLIPFSVSLLGGAASIVLSTLPNILNTGITFSAQQSSLCLGFGVTLGVICLIVALVFLTRGINNAVAENKYFSFMEDPNTLNVASAQENMNLFFARNNGEKTYQSANVMLAIRYPNEHALCC